MANMITDDIGRPIPQYQNVAGSAYEAQKGTGGASYVYEKDGHNEALGSTTDGATSNTVLGRLAQLLARIPGTLSAGGFLQVALQESRLLPAALSAQGNLKVEEQAPTVNTSDVALANKAYTATISSIDLDNPSARGVQVILDVTAVSGAPSLTLRIEGKDPASGKYYTLLEGAPVSAVGTTVYRVSPGLTAVANQAANDFLPKTWRVTVTHATADSVTYSVGYNLGV